MGRRHHDARSSRRSCRGDRHGAVRRPGRRPRCVVGEGILRPGGRGGSGDHRRLRAGEQQAGRAGLLSTTGAWASDRGGAEGRPTAGLRIRHTPHGLRRGMGARWSAPGPHRHNRSLLESVRSGRAALGDAAQREDRAEVIVRPADGAVPTIHPRMEEPAGAGGVHSRGHSEGVGCVLVVLVRSGAAGGTHDAGPRRHLGRRTFHVARTRSTPRTSRTGSLQLTRRST